MTFGGIITKSTEIRIETELNDNRKIEFWSGIITKSTEIRIETLEMVKK